MFHRLEEIDPSDCDYTLDVYVAAVIFDGGNALIRREDGTLLEGPVNADGSVTPRKGEFFTVTGSGQRPMDLGRSDDHEKDIRGGAEWLRQAGKTAEDGTPAYKITPGETVIEPVEGGGTWLVAGGEGGTWMCQEVSFFALTFESPQTIREAADESSVRYIATGDIKQVLDLDPDARLQKA